MAFIKCRRKKISSISTDKIIVYENYQEDGTAFMTELPNKYDFFNSNTIFIDAVLDKYRGLRYTIFEFGTDPELYANKCDSEGMSKFEFRSFKEIELIMGTHYLWGQKKQHWVVDRDTMTYPMHVKIAMNSNGICCNGIDCTLNLTMERTDSFAPFWENLAMNPIIYAGSYWNKDSTNYGVQPLNEVSILPNHLSIEEMVALTQTDD